MARFGLCALLACAAGLSGVNASVQINNGVALRIMPLGASETSGVGSSDGNGWRKMVWDALNAGGNPTTMVGSQDYGGNIPPPNNHYEAYPGQTVKNVFQFALEHNAFDTKPNVIIATLGTNDCIQSVPNTLEDAETSIGEVLEYIHQNLPETLTLVAGVIPWLPDHRDCINTFNLGIQHAVANQSAQGQLVEFWDLQGVLNTTTDYQSDGTHPTEAGYGKLAARWLEGLRTYGDLISAPIEL